MRLLSKSSSSINESNTLILPQTLNLEPRTQNCSILVRLRTLGAEPATG